MPKPKAADKDDEEEAVEEKPVKRAIPPKTSSARRKTPKKKVAAAKVDKETPPDVQTLLATLKNVRDEIDKIVTELKGE